MDRLPGRRAGFAAQPEGPCPECGGSGVLRTDAAGYRTCLACVGQGTLLRFEVSDFSSALAAAAAADVIAAEPALDELAVRRRRRGVSAWSSGG